MAKRTPIKAIRAKCLECSNGQIIEVRLCPCTDCPLYEYRFGKRPGTVEKNKARKEAEAVESTLEAFEA